MTDPTAEQGRNGLANVRCGVKRKTPWWEPIAAILVGVTIAWVAIFLAIPGVAWAFHLTIWLWARLGMFP